MTKSVSSGSSFRYPGEEITWAGECPFTDGLCFGTESGGILVPLPDSDNAAWMVEDLGDVVNGVAFGERIVAVSTPSSITFIRVDCDSPDTLGEVIAAIPTGAFDVIAIGRDRFLAPLGMSGLMLAALGDDGRIRTETVGYGDYSTYFYLARLVAATPSDATVAVAGRQSGLIRLQMREQAESANVGVWTFNDIDVVDVCPFPWPEAPLAVAALGLNGELIVCDDLTHGTPVAVRIPHIAGRAYSLRRVGAHLVILTKESIHIFEDFRSAGPLLSASKLQDRDIRIRSFENPPSEIYVAKETLLITERGDAIYVDDIDTILGVNPVHDLATHTPPKRAPGASHDWSKPTTFSETPQGIDDTPLTKSASLNIGPLVVA